MSAQYPSAVKTFTVKTDFVDTVLAEHVNSLQDEVNSLEANIGTYITTSSGWIGTFNQTTTVWNTLKDRIANLEFGLYSSFNDRVHVSGGSTITPSTTSTTGLTFQSIASQTADLVDFKDSTGTIVSTVGPDAFLYNYGKRIVPIVYTGTQPSGTIAAGSMWVDSSHDVPAASGSTGAIVGAAFSEFLLIGA